MLKGNDGMLNEIERACTCFVAPNFKLICMNVLGGEYMYSHICPIR